MSAEDSHSKPKLKISSENYLREEGSQDHLVADDGWFPASNRSGIFEALLKVPFVHKRHKCAKSDQCCQFDNSSKS